MIVKSEVISNNLIEFHECCAICERAIPEGAIVLRHTDTDNILCAGCLGLIALINPNDPIEDK